MLHVDLKGLKVKKRLSWSTRLYDFHMMLSVNYVQVKSGTFTFKNVFVCLQLENVVLFMSFLKMDNPTQFGHCATLHFFVFCWKTKQKKNHTGFKHESCILRDKKTKHNAVWFMMGEMVFNRRQTKLLYCNALFYFSGMKSCL